MKTVSLELSKQLKEAGYPQADRDVFYWFIDKKSFTINKEWKLYYAQLRTDFTDWEDSEWCASPTADEILDQLPESIFVGKVSEDAYNAYKIPHIALGDIEYYNSSQSESLADAAAKMWLYLKKEGILK